MQKQIKTESSKSTKFDLSNASNGNKIVDNIDDRKLKVEEEKLEIEKRKLAIMPLLDEFKVRSQEYFNFQNENSRWQGIYATALIIAASSLIDLLRN